MLSFLKDNPDAQWSIKISFEMNVSGFLYINQNPRYIINSEENEENVSKSDMKHKKQSFEGILQYADSLISKKDLSIIKDWIKDLKQSLQISRQRGQIINDLETFIYLSDSEKRLPRHLVDYASEGEMHENQEYIKKAEILFENEGYLNEKTENIANLLKKIGQLKIITETRLNERKCIAESLAKFAESFSELKKDLSTPIEEEYMNSDLIKDLFKHTDAKANDIKKHVDVIEASIIEQSLSTKLSTTCQHVKNHVTDLAVIRLNHQVKLRSLKAKLEDEKKALSDSLLEKNEVNANENDKQTLDVTTEKNHIGLNEEPIKHEEL